MYAIRSYYAVNSAWEDGEAEAAMNLLMGVISGLRTIRTEAEVHPSAKIEALLICPDAAKRQLLTDFSSGVQRNNFV